MKSVFKHIEAISYSHNKLEDFVNIQLSDIKIPTLPTVTVKVMLFDISNPNNGVPELEKLIQVDKGVTANLLKIANSALYGRSGSIKNLKNAITLMGVKTVKNLVVYQGTMKISAKLKGELYKTHLQYLPILTALIAFDLATPLGLKKLQQDLFLCGLLQKIGMTIFAVNYAEEYSEMIKSSEQGQKTLMQWEDEKFGIDYIELSLKVFERWNIPKMLEEVVAAQKYTLEQLTNSNDLSRLIRLSDILARRMLQLHISSELADIENAVFSFYQAPDEVIELFNEDYYEMIQDHPFFELVQ